MRSTSCNGKGMINKALLTLVLVMAAVFGVQAQSGSAPKITRYYPDVNDADPMEVRVNTSLFVYFDTKVSECNAQVIQNGAVVGSITYAGSSPATALPVKKDMLLAVLNGGVLQPGNFVVKPVDVTYPDADGNLVKYEDNAGEWLSVTYHFSGESAKVVSETEFFMNIVKSWYPADAAEGTKTITFNKPIAPGFSAVLEYGNAESSNNYAMMPVPCTLSEDGMSITIDLRGRLRNVDTMVPNAHFVDENGNPVDPPTAISLAVNNLYAVDGSPVIGIGKDMGATTNIELTARLHYSYHYSDLSFSTPRITSAKFDGDNLLMTLADNEALVSADVVFIGEIGNIASVSGVKFSGSSVSVALPAGLNTNNVLSISLDNAVYKSVDGVNHVIRPYVFKSGVAAIEVSSISDIKALSNADKFDISIDGVKVTYCNPEAGYIFIEDETGAVQVDPSSGFAPAEGSILSGKLEGTYLGEGLITINTANSEFTAIPGELSPMELTLGDITFPINNFRLATIALDDVNVEYSAIDNTYMLSMENLETPVMVYLDMIDDASFVAPASLEEVTGIIYSSPFVEGYMIVVRHSDDIKGSNVTPDPSISSLSEIKALSTSDTFTLVSDGVKVIYCNPEAGFIFIEDESGALQVDPSTGFAPAQGSILSGKIVGSYYGEGLIAIDVENSDFVANPATLSPKAVSLADIFVADNNYRLVSVDMEGVNAEYNADENMYILTAEGIDIPVMVYLDLIGDESFQAPEKIEYLAGVLYCSPFIDTYMIVVRGADDIKGQTSGIDSVIADGVSVAPVYSVSGVKVRDAGQTLQGLPAGIYITDGKKFFVK